ncbi:MAG: hypothetical protein JSW08_01380 [archaeon]|nr:MAG: hypothetical protein JSW08_01380 [archaeon]
MLIPVIEKDWYRIDAGFRRRTNKQGVRKEKREFYEFMVGPSIRYLPARTAFGPRPYHPCATRMGQVANPMVFHSSSFLGNRLEGRAEVAIIGRPPLLKDVMDRIKEFYAKLGWEEILG